MRTRNLLSCNFLVAASFSMAIPAAHAVLGFGGPSLLNTNATEDSASDQDAQLATDGLGVWVAVWQSNEDLNDAGTDADVFFSRSTNNGATWSDPAFLNTDAATDQAGDFDPQLITDFSGNWLVAWESNEDRNEADGDLDLFFSRSVNDGVSWSAPEALNTTFADDTGSDTNVRIATDAGTWVAVWESVEDILGADGDADIFVSRSSNSGASWSAPALLNTNAADDSEKDSEPRITTDFAGNFVTVWQSLEPLAESDSDWDIFVSRSTNSGQTWSDPELLNSNAATDGSHDTAPHIANDLDGHWVAVWQTNENMDGAGTDPDIWFTRSVDAGATWTTMKLLNAGHSTSDNGNDRFPRVLASSEDNWVAYWESSFNLQNAGNDFDIFVSRSTDGGVTWSAPGLLNANASSDTKDDANPYLATDDFGNWAAVWHSSQNLDGAGTDDDIFFSYSSTLEDPVLTVLTPNGGEKWKIGKKKKITWTSAKGLPQVKIELLRNGGVVKTIKNSTNDDGKQKWNIKNVEPGKGYKVRITAIASPENTDESDGTFKIKDAK